MRRSPRNAGCRKARNAGACTGCSSRSPGWWKPPTEGEAELTWAGREREPCDRLFEGPRYEQSCWSKKRWRRARAPEPESSSGLDKKTCPSTEVQRWASRSPRRWSASGTEDRRRSEGRRAGGGARDRQGTIDVQALAGAIDAILQEGSKVKIATPSVDQSSAAGRGGPRRPGERRRLGERTATASRSSHAGRAANRRRQGPRPGEHPRQRNQRAGDEGRAGRAGAVAPPRGGPVQVLQRTPAPRERVAMTPLRKRVAERLLQPRTTPRSSPLQRARHEQVMGLRKTYARSSRRTRSEVGFMSCRRATMKPQAVPGGQREHRRRRGRLSPLLRHRWVSGSRGCGAGGGDAVRSRWPSSRRGIAELGVKAKSDKLNPGRLQGTSPSATGISARCCRRRS